MNRHMLTDDSGREVARAVVYLDAFDGWVRETGLQQGQYATVVVAPDSDPAAGNHSGRIGRHRRPQHRISASYRYRTVCPLTFRVHYPVR